MDPFNSESLTVPLNGQLAAKWQNGHGLLVGKTSYNVSKKPSNPSTTLYFLNWSTQMYMDEFVARLAIASHDIFKEFHANEQKLPEIIHLTSRKYRALLKNILNEIQTYLNQPSNDANDEEMARRANISVERDIIETYEIIWHLVEIIMIDPIVPQETLLSTSLLSCFIQRFPQGLEYHRNLLQHHQKSRVHRSNYLFSSRLDDSEQHADLMEGYWPALSLLVLQGQLQEASSLLTMCPDAIQVTLSKAECQLLTQMSNLFLTMPPVGKLDVTGKVKQDLHCWKSSLSGALTEYFHNQSHFHVDPQHGSHTPLADLCEIMVFSSSILSGESTDCNAVTSLHLVAKRWIEPWLENDAMCDHHLAWYWIMMPYIYYGRPFLSRRELDDVSKTAKQLFDSSCNDNWLDTTIAHLLNLSFSQFFYQLSVDNNNWWLLTHLVDLLVGSSDEDIVSSHSKSTSGSGSFTTANQPELRENFIVQYVESMWASATGASNCMEEAGGCNIPYLVLLTYLDQCPKQGAHMVEELLQRIPITAKDRIEALQLHHILMKRGLYGISDVMCYRLARDCLRQSSLLEALHWARCFSGQHHRHKSLDFGQLLNAIGEEWIFQKCVNQSHCLCLESLPQQVQELCKLIPDNLPPGWHYSKGSMLNFIFSFNNYLCENEPAEKVPLFILWMNSLQHLKVHRLNPTNFQSVWKMLMEVGYELFVDEQYKSGWTDFYLGELLNLLSVCEPNFKNISSASALASKIKLSMIHKLIL